MLSIYIYWERVFLEKQLVIHLFVYEVVMYHKSHQSLLMCRKWAHRGLYPDLQPIFFFFENTHQDILIATPSTHLHVLIFDQKWEINLIKIQASQDWYLSVYKITTTNGLLKNIEQIKNNQTVLVSLLNLLHFVTTIKTLHQFCCLVC